jgi:cell division protein FtsB
MLKKREKIGIMGTMEKETGLQTFRKRLFGSRIFIWGGMVVLVFILFSLGKAALKKHEVDTEIQKLQTQVSSLQNQDTELSGLIQYFKTQNFQERQAREDLGLKKPGETIVAIASTNATDAPVFSDSAQSNTSQISNPKKWWNYFFIIHL